MKLTLTVLSIQGEVPFSSMEYIFDQMGGSVGRAQSASWVLLDDKRFLSGVHFKIHCDGKFFSIMDSSTNGTFINDSILPLGLDNSHVLTDGDTIKIGEYTIIVSSILQNISNSDNNEGDHNIVHNDLTSGSSQRDPFFSADGYFNETVPPKRSQDTLNNKGESSFLNNDMIEGKTPTTEDPFFSPNDDTFTPDEVTPILDDVATAQPTYSVNMNTPINTNTLINREKNDEDDVFGFLNEEIEVLNKLEVQQDPVVERKIAQIKEVETTSNTKPKANTEFDTSQSDARKVLVSLLKGAGVSSNHIPLEVSDETLEILGGALKEVIQGTIDLLKSRSEIKNHLHLDRTIINSVENNPLKFLPNAQEVIKLLLTTESKDKTYMPLKLALEEAFDDVKAHQIAMTGAGEKALRAVIKQHFSPINLAENIAKTNPISAVIPVKRQAKLWSMFEALYDDVEKEATDSFQRLLDHEISKAYEEQLLEIKDIRGRQS